jgi:Tautomerase enzyme
METSMPLVKIHVLKGRSPDEVETLLDTIHDVVVESFAVPRRDRYQILLEHEASHFRALDTGLGIARSHKFLLLEITSRPRADNAKVAFYSNLVSALQARCDVAPSDVMITLQINADEDWSFGLGRAQFLTGEL